MTAEGRHCFRPMGEKGRLGWFLVFFLLPPSGEEGLGDRGLWRSLFFTLPPCPPFPSREGGDPSFGGFLGLNRAKLVGFGGIGDKSL